MTQIGKELEVVTITPEPLVVPEVDKPEVDVPAPLVKPELVPA